MPKVEDLFATLSNEKLFTKLNLRQAYQQLLLDDEFKKYVLSTPPKACSNTQVGPMGYN